MKRTAEQSFFSAYGAASGVAGGCPCATKIIRFERLRTGPTRYQRPGPPSISILSCCNNQVVTVPMFWKLLQFFVELLNSLLNLFPSLISWLNLGETTRSLRSSVL